MRWETRLGIFVDLVEMDDEANCVALFKTAEALRGIEGFLSPNVYLKSGVPQDSNQSPLLFYIYVNDMLNSGHHQTNKSQFVDEAGQWAVSKNIDLATEYLQRDLDKLAR